MADLVSTQRTYVPPSSPNPVKRYLPTIPQAGVNPQVATGVSPAVAPSIPQVNQTELKRPSTAFVPVAQSLSSRRAPDAGGSFVKGLLTSLGTRQAAEAEQYEIDKKEAEAAAERTQAANLLREQYPGMEHLARGVEIGAWDASTAMNRAGEMASEWETDRQNAQLRQQQSQYLRDNGRADLADMLDSGLITTEDVASSILPGGGGDLSAKEEQIQRLESTGLTREQAINVADGRMRLDTNPVTGERVMVDLGTGTSSPVAQPDYGNTQAPDQAEAAAGAASPEAEPSGDLKLWDMVDSATGVGPSIGVTSSNTIGQLPGAVGGMFTNEEAVRAEREFELFKRDLIRSLSLNPKFPVAEQQRIENLMQRGPLIDSGTLRISLETMDREMARIEQELIEAINDPKTPIEQRASDRQTLRGIMAARDRMGVPQGAGQGAAGGTGSGVESMSDEELLQVLGQ